MIIIYDNNGKIWYNGSGMGEPAGLPFLNVDIPEGQYIESVDVSGDEPKPVFKEYPKSEFEVLKNLVNDMANKNTDGTEECPIVWFVGMVSENGKYYVYDNVVYKCIRDLVNPLHYVPGDLLGHYFELV